MADQPTKFAESNALLAIQLAQMDGDEDFEAEAREILADFQFSELAQLAKAASALNLLCRELAHAKRHGH